MRFSDLLIGLGIGVWVAFWGKVFVWVFEAYLKKRGLIDAD